MGDGDCSYSWLDEMLCEYVDGTMDAAVRRSFEEYLATDPVLAQQVERLRRTRTLLCRHGCQLSAPQGLQARVRRRLSREMMRPQPPFLAEAASRLGAAAAFGSVMVVTLMVGMFVGATLLAETQRPVAARGNAAPNLVWQDARPTGMTPLAGHTPLRRPRFVNRPAPPPLSKPGYLLPEVLYVTDTLQPALQRSHRAP